MVLTPGEKLQSSYRKLYEEIESRLKSARGTLENPLAIDETNRVRGRILELKLLLNAMTEEYQPPPAD